MTVHTQNITRQTAQHRYTDSPAQIPTQHRSLLRTHL